MGTKTIYVSRNGQSNNIKLRDSEGHNPGNDKITTDVNPGDIVIWEVDPNENDIYALKGIAKKSDSPANLLTGTPQLQSNGSYSGQVVSNTNMTDQIEKYDVSYQIVVNGPTFTDDPKLRMKAPGTGR